MKFNIWTFAFQLINFFVLMLILKRLLYRPVREIMEKRRALVQKTIDDAEKTRHEALALRDEYLKKSAGIDRLRVETLDRAEDDAQSRRNEVLQKAEEEAKVMFQREEARLAVEKKKIESELKDAIMDNSLSYASAVLSDLADENLHRSILDKLMESVPGIAVEVKGAADAAREPSVEITSAYPLPDAFAERVRNEFESVFSKKTALNTRADRGLIAGAVIRVFDRVYDASLKGQLKAFRQRLRKIG